MKNKNEVLSSYRWQQRKVCKTDALNRQRKNNSYILCMPRQQNDNYYYYRQLRKENLQPGSRCLPLGSNCSPQPTLPSPLPFPLPCSETGQRPESSEYVCSLETSVTLACNSTKSLTRFQGEPGYTMEPHHTCTSQHARWLV